MVSRNRQRLAAEPRFHEGQGETGQIHRSCKFKDGQEEAFTSKSTSKTGPPKEKCFLLLMTALLCGC